MGTLPGWVRRRLFTKEVAAGNSALARIIKHQYLHAIILLVRKQSSGDVLFPFGMYLRVCVCVSC